MPSVRVVTDTACDLPDDVLHDLGVKLVPLRIRFGDEEFVDRVQLSTKEFWARCADFASLPSTAAPSPGQFREVFDALAAEGAEGVVCVNLSSKLSATIDAARSAAQEAEIPVRVVDSLSVTMGHGLVVIAAAEAAAAGADLPGVVAATEDAARRLKLYGAIDTLENLKRGGRIGGARALVGSMLSIKPVIEVRSGIVEEESKQRTRGKSLRYLADKVKDAAPVERLAVFSADAPDISDFLVLLDGVETRDPTLLGDVGPVIGSHAGRGAIGVAYIPASP